MQLLEDGVPVKERGKTRSRGRIREIMILKAPVYDQDQIVGLIGFFMDITNTSKQINRLENEAARDDLTSLKKRHNFARDFNYLTGKPILAMMLDVDHFKKFNDNFGHRYGDEVLKKISQALLKIYGIGHCYRYGGTNSWCSATLLILTRLRKKTGSSGKNWNMPGSWIFT
ncbi:GGDEF domain-containing protein [Lactobacillus delbrueckii subsp. bulgaricus]|uniref:GGDEF domain-containing protein n=1 Tax=Lactobacillus delbrueckii TaxID=1584 RepID=UPI0030B94FAA